MAISDSGFPPTYRDALTSTTSWLCQALGGRLVETLHRGSAEIDIRVCRCQSARLSPLRALFSTPPRFFLLRFFFPLPICCSLFSRLSLSLSFQLIVQPTTVCKLPVFPEPVSHLVIYGQKDRRGGVSWVGSVLHTRKAIPVCQSRAVENWSLSSVCMPPCAFCLPTRTSGVPPRARCSAALFQRQTATTDQVK